MWVERERGEQQSMAGLQRLCKLVQNGVDLDY